MKRIISLALLLSVLALSCFSSWTKNPLEKPNQKNQFVDLGLSVKWATCNVGASSPEKYGGYYAWGETKEKKDYYWSSYNWGTYGELIKYCSQPEYGYNGFMDNYTVLDSGDDVARVKLGSSWRIPTEAEWSELLSDCSWTWTSNYKRTGVSGYIVKSKKSGYTDNSIFLPAAGCRSETNLADAGSYGYYWSSSLYTSFPTGAWSLYFYSDDAGTSEYFRYYGFPVRPVSD